MVHIISIKIETACFHVQLTLREFIPLHEFAGIHFQDHHLEVVLCFSLAIVLLKKSPVLFFNPSSCEENVKLSYSGRTLMKFSSIIDAKDDVIWYFNVLKWTEMTVDYVKVTPRKIVVQNVFSQLKESLAEINKFNYDDFRLVKKECCADERNTFSVCSNDFLNLLLF